MFRDYQKKQPESHCTATHEISISSQPKYQIFLPNNKHLMVLLNYIAILFGGCKSIT